MAEQPGCAYRETEDGPRWGCLWPCMSLGALCGDFWAAVKLQQLWNEVRILLESSWQGSGPSVLEAYQEYTDCNEVDQESLPIRTVVWV